MRDIAGCSSVDRVVPQRTLPTTTIPAMPSALSSGPASAERHDDLDNYDVDNFSDDPFGSPPPTASTKKRKEPESGLGIDKEVSVQKRARVPNVKLDEER